MNKKNNMGLRTKFVFFLVVMCVAITFAVTLVGIRVYRLSCSSQYNETAYQAARIVADLFTEEELRAYADLTKRYNAGDASDEEIEKAMADEHYIEIKKTASLIREEMNANDILIFVTDMDVLENYDEAKDKKGNWNPLIYIMDNYHVEEEQFRLGDKSSIIQDYCDDIIKAYNTGKPTDNLFIADSQFGYTTSAIYPVAYDGETVAFVSVEIPMSMLNENIHTFVVRSVAAAAITALIILFIEVFILIKTLIHPIKLVSEEAERFVADNTEISEKLHKIRTKDEIQVLSESILKLERDINVYIENLTQVTAEKEKAGAEMNIATRIQNGALPNNFKEFCEHETFSLYASMNPAKEVGGDFYDFFMVDENHLALVMADVSGKGVPAALFMMVSKIMLQNAAKVLESPAKVFEKVNNQLCVNNEASLFVTVWMGVLDVNSGRMVCCNAGHEYPALRRGGENFELVHDKHGMVLAGMEDVPYMEYELWLHKGDTLFIYTDGVAEATDANEELFGTDRMLDALNKKADASCENVLQNVMEAIDGFVGNAEQFDDITMLALHIDEEMG